MSRQNYAVAAWLFAVQARREGDYRRAWLRHGAVRYFHRAGFGPDRLLP